MEEKFYDLTFCQKAIWDEERFFEKSPLNNIAGIMFINGAVDLNRLKKSVTSFLKKNDIFSLRLKMDNDGNVHQYFDSMAFFNGDYEVFELHGHEEAVELVNAWVNVPHDVVDSKLFDIKFFAFDDGSAGLVMLAHHIIFDAWCFGIASKQVLEIYQGLDGDTVYYSYLDRIKSEQDYLSSAKFLKDKEYWEGLLSDLPDTVSVPVSKKIKNSSNSPMAKRKDFIIKNSLYEKISDFCEKNKISPYAFFMSVYSIYLGRVNSSKRFNIGTPVLNRNNFQEKNTVGLYISTIPFCVEIDWKKNFIDLVKDISVRSLTNFRHQKYPYQMMVDYAKENHSDLSFLYNVFISYQNARNTEFEDLDYYTKWCSPDAIFNDVQIHIHDMNDDDSYTISYDYNISKYSEKDFVSLHKRIVDIMEQVFINNEIDLCDIEIVTEAEKANLLGINDTFRDYDRDKSIHCLIEEQARKNPEKVAVISNGESISYRELNERANSLAHYLRDLGVRPNSFVGILQKRSVKMMVSLLAVLKAGGAYLPLDFSYPANRLSYMIENSGAEVVLTEDGLDGLIENGDVKKILVDLDDSIFDENMDDLDDVNSSSDIAYIIYTSGSTGKPKGVELTHRNVNNFIVGMCDRIDFNSDKTIVSVTTICFDIFVLESWLPLQCGMTIVVANEDEQNDQVLLNGLMLKNGVNIIQTTPSRLKKLTANKEYCTYFKFLTECLVGGEAFPTSLLDKLKRLGKFNGTRIYNVYGPTETAVWSCTKDLTNSSNITIGKPISNTSCYVWDSYTHRLLPKGAPGKLFIGGDGVCNGYHLRDDLNESLFTRSLYGDSEVVYDTNDLAYITSSNEFCHLGRADFQVKIRGYRVEIQEIENRVLAYKYVTEACVLAQDSNYLICYYASSKDIVISDLVSFLLDDLPNYMIPVYFVKMDKLPLTPNGKIDRKGLPRVDFDKSEKIVAAQSDTEKLLEKYILEILNNGLRNVDVNTPFISLGLDSLSIVQLQSMLLSEKLNLTTQTFYKYPTIRELAKFIESSDSVSTEKAFELSSELMHDDDERIIDKNDNVLGNVLITGANGFVGAHVLYEILTTTDSVCYCLVRGADISFAIKRLYSAFKFYFNIDLNEEFLSRVVVVNGDVALENLGLNEIDRDLIVRDVSTIIHSAAIVKHYGNFDEFRKINIAGTNNIVDFAYRNSIRFIHISSISVSGNYLLKQNQSDVDFSENNLYIGQHYSENVYVNSKFESENVVYDYMQKGLRGKVLRIGIISGRLSDGMFQKNIEANAFYSRIRSLVLVGAVSENLLSQKIEFTPVDECARAIVLLAKTGEFDNKIFHLYNHNLICLKDVVDRLGVNGFNVDVISNEDFSEKIINYSKSKNAAISAIVNDFDTSNLSLDYNFTVNIKSDYSQTILRDLGFEWNVNGENYLDIIIKYMKDVNFI